MVAFTFVSIKTSASGHYQVVKKSRDHTLLACANLPPKTFIFMHYSMSIVLKFQGASHSIFFYRILDSKCKFSR